MALFGLFATLFGLGCVAKDNIEWSIFESKNRQNAIAKNKTWYMGKNAKMISTKTGKSCHREFKNRHWLLVDDQTTEVIEDETLTKNIKREAKEKIEAQQKGCVFYRKAEFDNHGKCKCNVWVSDIIPGYFYRLGRKVELKEVELKDDYFIKGELSIRKLGSSTETYVHYTSDSEQYYGDGTKYTKDESIRRDNIRRRQYAIEKGYKFYRFDRTATEPYGYKDVETDEYYYYDEKEQYYCRGKVVEEQYYKQTKPHHEPELINFKKVVKANDTERFNLDGTKWFP